TGSARTGTAPFSTAVLEKRPAASVPYVRWGARPGTDIYDAVHICAATGAAPDDEGNNHDQQTQRRHHLRARQGRGARFLREQARRRAGRRRPAGGLTLAHGAAPG